jgi:hypothetical protein
VYFDTLNVTVTVTVTGNLLNTKVLTLVSRQLSQPVQSPNYMHVGHQALGALPSTNPYYQIASPHVVESGKYTSCSTTIFRHVYFDTLNVYLLQHYRIWRPSGGHFEIVISKI